MPYDRARSIEELIVVPEDAQYLAALGAVEFGAQEVLDHPDLGVFDGVAALEAYLTEGRGRQKRGAGRRALVGDNRRAGALPGSVSPSRLDAAHPCLRIRIETMAYSLGRYREELARRRRAMDEIEDRLHALERTLHAGSSEPVDPGPADAPTSRVHEDRTAVR